LVDRAEVLLGARAEVLAVGELRDLLQGGFIESGADSASLQPDDRAGSAPDADRVHADATRNSLIHDVERRRELIVLAIGEEDDRRGRGGGVTAPGGGRNRGGPARGGGGGGRCGVGADWSELAPPPSLLPPRANRER